jgi:DNA replication protein DnaC
MERTQILDLMGELKLYGMKAAFDEIMATAIKRQHEPQRIVGDLLTAEISEKQARSIKYQLTIAKLPLAKDFDDFQFDGTPINQTLVKDLAGGGFIAQQRNVVLVGGTGTGKTHLAIAIARNCIRDVIPLRKQHSMTPKQSSRVITSKQTSMRTKRSAPSWKRRSAPARSRATVCQSALEWDPPSASKGDPFDRRALLVALASSELVGVAQTARARVA